MRTLVISDTHLGAWTGDDLLSHGAIRERFAPLLDGVDELVVLGDLFDFLFSTVEHAVAAADPLLDLLADRLAGRRLVFLAGNHDHRVMARELDLMVEEQLATGEDFAELGPRLREQNWFLRMLRRRLPDTDCGLEYPTYTVGDVLLTHGHYLDAHVRGSLANRLLTRTIWTISGGQPHAPLTIADYEGVIVPLTELLYTVAQLPRGTAAQQTLYAQIQRLGHVIQLGTAPEHEIGRLVHALGRHRHTGQPDAPVDHETVNIARAIDPSDPTSGAVEAFAEVVRNLDWNAVPPTHPQPAKIVFAHTHQPLSDVRADSAPDAPRLWNTGCWIHEPPSSTGEAYVSYLEHAWPGTAVLIDSDAEDPQLLRPLADLNPLERARRGTTGGSDALAAPPRFQRAVHEHLERESA